VLDGLEELAKNSLSVACFFDNFGRVFDQTRQYSPKYFIIQASDSISSEEMAKVPKAISSTTPKTCLEPANKLFFNKFVSLLINNSCSLSMFCFARTFRNLKVFGDAFKLSNSNLFLYQTASPEYRLKFYY
jgi:hypothetical protein